MQAYWFSQQYIDHCKFFSQKYEESLGYYPHNRNVYGTVHARSSEAEITI